MGIGHQHHGRKGGNYPWSLVGTLTYCYRLQHCYNRLQVCTSICLFIYLSPLFPVIHHPTLKREIALDSQQPSQIQAAEISLVNSSTSFDEDKYIHLTSRGGLRALWVYATKYDLIHSTICCFIRLSSNCIIGRTQNRYFWTNSCLELAFVQ